MAWCTENRMPSPENIYIGTAGWSYKDWQGTVYPDQIKTSMHPVEYLARYFDMIEINTSFYGHIRPEWGKLWCHKARQGNAAFLFTAKLNRAFTHAPAAFVQSTSAASLSPTQEDERLAKAGLDSIAQESMLGALLIQFPISFKNTNENREYLDQLLSRFRDYPPVVEVRHSSWDNEGILQYFNDRGVAFCNIDQPMLGKAMGRTGHATAPLGYVRLHGRNYDQWFESESRDERYNYLYTVPQLEGWKSKIGAISRKADKTFVVANNHFRGQAAVNALQLKNLLTGDKQKIPPQLLETYPQLNDIRVSE